MLASKWRPEPSTVCTYTSCSGVSGVWSNSSDMPSTPFMGVRISWLMVARNLDLAALAASAACFNASVCVMSASRWRMARSSTAMAARMKSRLQTATATMSWARCRQLARKKSSVRLRFTMSGKRSTTRAAPNRATARESTMRFSVL